MIAVQFDMDVSNLTRILVEKRAIELEPYYVGNIQHPEEAIQSLDEFFRYNIKDCDSYYHSVTIPFNVGRYGTDNQKSSIININHFGSASEKSYILYTEGGKNDPTIVRYFLKKPISLHFVKDHLFDGIISLRVLTIGGKESNLLTSKEYVGNGMYCRETYQSSENSASRIIKTRVYNIDDLLGKETSATGELMLDPKPIDKDPWFLTYNFIDIVVEGTEEGRYIIKYNGKPIEISGNSIYSAYYDFMVKIGIFEQPPIGYKK